MATVPFNEAAARRKRDWITSFGDDYKSEAQGTAYEFSKMARTVTRRPYRRPTNRRRRRRYRRRMRKMSAGIPPTLVRRMVTSYPISLDPGSSGALTSAQVYLNSAFDPSGTVSATLQPLGFDQYEALYNKYVVVGWKVTVECALLENTYPCIVGFTPMTTSSALTTSGHYRELPGTVSRLGTPDIDKIVFGAKGGVKKWLIPQGGKILSDEECSAAVSTNPSKLLYGHFWIQSLDTSADAGICRLIVKHEQIVVFFDRKTPSRSTQ